MGASPLWTVDRETEATYRIGVFRHHKGGWAAKWIEFAWDDTDTWLYGAQPTCCVHTVTALIQNARDVAIAEHRTRCVKEV